MCVKLSNVHTETNECVSPLCACKFSMKLPILKWTHTHTYERNFIPSSKHTHTPIKAPKRIEPSRAHRTIKENEQRIFTVNEFYGRTGSKRKHNRTKFAVNPKQRILQQRFFSCKLIFVLPNFSFLLHDFRFVVANVSACVCAFWWIIIILLFCLRYSPISIDFCSSSSCRAFGEEKQ